jgi:CheY-like chemotaxis protein
MLDHPESPLILVIDDQVTLGQLIKRIAKRVFPDAEVLVATSGLVGLNLAEQYSEALSLVILDVHMPIVDGRTVCAGIRGMAPNVPIIACTFDTAALPVLLELGCVGAITKPFLLNELIDQLQQARVTPVAPLPTTGWAAAMCDQARTLLAFARGMPAITNMNGTAVSEDLVVLPRATITKIHAQLDEHYQRVSRSRELRQVIKTLREALD